MWRPVRREKVAGETNDALRLGPITVDAHDVDLLAEGQAEQLKGLQCARSLASPAVGGAPGFEVGKEPENTPMGVNQSGLVARPLVGAGSHRNGFWPIDRRRIENAETKQPRARPFRPLDGERRRAFAVRRAIEGDERRSQRGHDRQPMRSSEARDDVQAELPEIVLASTDRKS